MTAVPSGSPPLPDDRVDVDREPERLSVRWGIPRDVAATYVAAAAIGYGPFTRVVATPDGIPLGVGYRSLDRIEGLYVCRGARRRGIGAAIMADLVAGARGAGMRTLRLECKLPLAAFYARMGWRMLGSYPFLKS